MQKVVEYIDALICELHYEVGDTKDRERIATYYIAIALLEKAAAVLRMTLG